MAQGWRATESLLPIQLQALYSNLNNLEFGSIPAAIIAPVKSPCDSGALIRLGVSELAKHSSAGAMLSDLTSAVEQMKARWATANRFLDNRRSTEAFNTSAGPNGLSIRTNALPTVWQPRCLSSEITREDGTVTTKVASPCGTFDIAAVALSPDGRYLAMISSARWASRHLGLGIP